MDTDKPQLREALERLHAELEQTKTVDPEARQLLQHLQNDIQAVLRKPNASSWASLGRRLDDAVARLEETHPDLTLTIKQVLDNLAGV